MSKRVMGLDVGDARIGIALSDPLGMISQPHDTIDRNASSIEAICRIIDEKDVGTVVVGLPLDLSGEESEQTKKTRKFADELQSELQKINVSLVFWDERLSSIEAERFLGGSKLKNRKRRETLDRVAASVILEAYLLSVQRH